MVPSTYHSFFSGAVSVSGALTGLLFVAISIEPRKLSGEQASLAFQLRAGMAFTALISALVLSLVALLPGSNLGVWGMVVSISALSSVLGMALTGIRRTRGTRHRLSLGVRLATMVALFVLQLVASVALLDSPHRTSSVDIDTIVVIALFLVAINRAWELLGGTGSGLISLFVHAGVRHVQQGRGGKDGSEQ